MESTGRESSLRGLSEGLVRKSTVRESSLRGLNDTDRRVGRVRFFTGNRRIRIPILVLCLLLSIPLLSRGCRGDESRQRIFPEKTAVLLGASPENVLGRVEQDGVYQTLILDLQNFSKEQVSALHHAGVKKIYSYLDVGSLETYRPYFTRFQKLVRAPYENWEEEYWVDVSNISWQDFLVKELASDLVQKGADGFFLDNTDVYAQEETPQTYEGLVRILEGLGDYHLPVIVNGGDLFVKKLIADHKQNLLRAVCQESVFSCIKDYKKNQFGRQNKEVRDDYLTYLQTCKKANLSVLLIEYTKDSKLEEEVDSYCKKMGFRLFVSKSLALEE